MTEQVHTLHIEGSDGTIRQYGFHLGTLRDFALREGWERATSKLRQGAKSVALKQGGEIVTIWDFRDLASDNVQQALGNIEKTVSVIDGDADIREFLLSQVALIRQELPKCR
jgi:hypothetical protein